MMKRPECVGSLSPSFYLTCVRETDGPVSTFPARTGTATSSPLLGLNEGLSAHISVKISLYPTGPPCTFALLNLPVFAIRNGVMAC